MTRAGLVLGLAVIAMACGTETMTPTDAGGGEVDAGAADAGGGSDAGGGMDAATDAGSMSDAGADATVMWPDAGTLPAPEWADLTVGPAGSCPGFTPCGGDIVGVWDLNGGCFEVDIESSISACPGAMVTRRVGRGRGRVVFRADGTAHRVAESVVEADTFFPAVCTAFYSCDMLQSAMRMLVTEATCTEDSAGDCNCTSRLITSIDDTDTYTIEGNEIVGGFSGKRWEYCIAGDRLDYRDSSPSGPLEPGDIELLRR